MINFIVGRSGSGKSTLLEEMIKNEINNGARRVVLIVPEQQAVVWETKMAAALPASANLRLEITNFTRLSNSVFRQGGGLVDTVIDEGSRGLLVWRAMRSVWEHLRVYNRGHEDRCIPLLTRAIDELKSSGISPLEAEEALIRLASQQGGASGEGDLCSRLSDAVTVYAAYEEILHTEYIDRGDLLANLTKALDRCDYFRGKAVFIDSFFSLTAPEERILHRIMSQADELTLTFTCPTDADSRRSQVQFGECADYLKSASRMASALGLEVRRTELTENKRHSSSPVLSSVEKHLFSYTEALPEGCDSAEEGEVRIIKCTDRFDEAEACAAIIESLYREGYKSSDIAVVAGNMSSREGILDTVLRRHGINCFMSEPGSVSSSPAVRLVQSALAVAVGGWQRKSIIRLLKTGMTPVGRDPSEEMEAFEGDIFEKYTDTWSIRGRKMYTSEDWSMNPEGYKAEISDSARQTLRWANSAKNKLIPPLDRLLSIFDGGVAAVRDICTGIVRFAEEYSLQRSLAELGRSYRGIGMTADAKKAEASWSAVCEILDKMVTMLGETNIDAAGFSGLFGRVAASMDIGTIPTGIDEVVLGNATGIRFDKVRCMIMLGSVDGEFPASAKDGGSFFDDGERAVLESVGLNVASPDADKRTAREYFMYYRAAAAPSDKLYVLIPTDSGEPSEGARRISAITEAMGCSSTVSFASMPLSEVVFSRAGAEYQLSRRSSDEELALLTSLAGGALESSVPLTAENDYIINERINSVRRMNLSQQKIDTFVKCPFDYSCTYILGLQPESKAEIGTLDIGNFIHHVLEHFFTQISVDRLLREDITEEELCKISDEIIKSYLDTLIDGSGTQQDGKRDGRIEYLFMRLCRYVPLFLRAIVRELRQGKFKPVALELPIGKAEEGAIPSISFKAEDGTEVFLEGKLDRADIYDDGEKKYLRIVDYKTGDKTFSLADVRQGLNAQLLIYLFSLWKNGLSTLGIDGELIPAGAVYLSLKPAYSSTKKHMSPEEAKEYTIDHIVRSGVYLSDEDVLRAMDSQLDGKYVKVKLSKDELKAASGNSLLTLEQFGRLYTELETVIGSIAAEMKRGKAEANPLKNSDACKYCENKYICRIRAEEEEE